MADIKFSSDAILDLQEIQKYITNELCNEQAANDTIAKILKSIRVLEDFPESGSPLKAVVNINTDYRSVLSEKYRTFYRYENGTVFIIRILYGYRNFMKILFGEKTNE